MQQIINASCACDAVPVNASTSITWGAQVYLPLNNTADHFLPPSLVQIGDVAAYKAIYCAQLDAGV